MTGTGGSRPVFVRLRDPSLDQRVPLELMAALAMEPADVLRTGSRGFTAMLSDAQRTTAQSQPIVANLEDNPECLAPLEDRGQNPDIPNRYVVCTLRSVGSTAEVVAGIDSRTADVQIMGMWFIATLTADQLNALRRTPGVDFIAPAIMAYPA